LNRLHIYKGKEYSKELNISHLLYQTSGLPDDFEEGRDNTKERTIHQDMEYSFNEIIELTKRKQSHFRPSTGKRAHYASVNFDLLGKIIEIVTNLSLEEAYKQFIFDPLKLTKTYLPKTDEDFVPKIYYKDQTIHRPKFIKSCGASGGAISTARELMVFMKAFFKGELFDKNIFQELERDNKLQFAMYPIHYGAGFMRIPLNGFVTFFMGKGELIGHSGSTGSFAFYFPRKDLFFVGDVNQMNNPALPIRLAMRLAMTM